MSVKRSMDNSHQVSSSGSSNRVSNSKLWEKNKMLASLLAKEPSQPTTIPPIPASVISATPQVRFSVTNKFIYDIYGSYKSYKLLIENSLCYINLFIHICVYIYMSTHSFFYP